MAGGMLCRRYDMVLVVEIWMRTLQEQSVMKRLSVFLFRKSEILEVTRRISEARKRDHGSLTVVSRMIDEKED
ncbi:hypothetical protein Tco_0845521 [Tanacetum coccineum]